MAAEATAVTPRPLFPSARRGLVTGDEGSEWLAPASFLAKRPRLSLSRGERGRPFPGACGGGDDVRERTASDDSVAVRRIGLCARDMARSSLAERSREGRGVSLCVLSGGFGLGKTWPRMASPMKPPRTYM